MPIQKKLVLGLVVSATALSLAACSSNSSGAPASSKTVSIVLVQGTTALPFAQVTAAGAKAAAQAVGGIKFSVAGPANIDPATETKDFQQVVAARPDGIVLQELPPDLFTRLVKDAESSGITVLPYNIAPAANSSSTSFVGDNGLELGRKAADVVADAVVKSKGADASGQIVTGICVPGLSVLTQRLDGFKAEMAKRLPKVQVLDAFNSQSDPAADFTVWQQAVSAHPDALAMISPCEADNENLIKIKRASNAKWFLVPFDIDSIALGAVKDGTVLQIIPQSPYVHGYVSIRLLAESLKTGKPLPKGWVKTPIIPVTSANVDEIIKRESSPANQAAYWKPYIDKIFATNPVQTLPLTDANK